MFLVRKGEISTKRQRFMKYMQRIMQFLQTHTDKTLEEEPKMKLMHLLKQKLMQKKPAKMNLQNRRQKVQSTKVNEIDDVLMGKTQVILLARDYLKMVRR